MDKKILMMSVLELGCVITPGRVEIHISHDPRPAAHFSDQLRIKYFLGKVSF